MSLKDAVSEIPELVKILKEKFYKKEVFKDAKLADGTIVRYDGETPAIQTQLNVIATDGSVLPAPDGEYQLEDGTVLSVVNGLIQDVKPAEQASEAPNEEVMQDESAPMTEQAAKRIIESIVKESVFALDEKLESIKNEYAEKFEALKKENEELSKKNLENESLLKETFSLVEKIASLPSEESKHEKKDGFKKKQNTDTLSDINEWRKKYL